MGDDLSRRRPQDASRINVHEPYEANYWTDKFGVSKAALVAAVNEVGTSASAVESYLKTTKK
jgi:hypothetical protein